MGKIVDNPITSSFSGKFGSDLVFRKIGNRTFFSRKGVSNKPPTSAQDKNRQIFAEAQNYASKMLADPKYSEWYSIVANVNGMRSAQLAAVKDFMSRPEIKSINTKNYRGSVGDVIHIKPKMLLKIDRIEITLHKRDGSILETGLAVKSEMNWKYICKIANYQVEGSRIAAVAYDKLEKSHAVTCYLDSED